MDVSSWISTWRFFFDYIWFFIEQKELKLMEHVKDGVKGVNVFGLEEVSVSTAQDIFKVLDKGLKQRNVAETKLNKTSR